VLDLDDFFAAGGNRCCFTYPGKPELCIKVNRVDRSPAFKKAKAPFYKKIRSLDAFDENREESKVLSELEKIEPSQAGELFPQCYGWVETPFGRGLSLTMFRDKDGEISGTLEMELLENGASPQLNDAIERFKQKWREIAVPSRQLLLHNIIIRKDADHWRLAVIDGLGSGESVPLSKWFPKVRRKQIERRLVQLDQRLKDFQEICEQGVAIDKGWVRQRTQPLDCAFKLQALGLDPNIAM